jgi:uncharacterized protein (TIGR02996 family)
MAPPSQHTLLRPQADAVCATCGRRCAEGELALAEAYVSTDGKWARSHRYARTPRRQDGMSDDGFRDRFDSINADIASRFHHLACAAEHQPYKLRSALKASDDASLDRPALERAIAEALTPKDRAEADPRTRPEYLAFVERLRESTHDHDFLVFGDWLAGLDDPRGELVRVHHALETATGEHRVELREHEDKLLLRHRFIPEQQLGKLVWHRGFVRKLVKPLRPYDPELLRHPSLRFLRATDVTEIDDEPPEPAIVRPAAPPPKKKDGPIEWRVRHTRKPDWGIGRVIAEHDAALEVEFEHGGVRHVKNVELLVDVD